MAVESLAVEGLVVESLTEGLAVEGLAEGLAVDVFSCREMFSCIGLCWIAREGLAGEV